MKKNIFLLSLILCFCLNTKAQTPITPTGGSFGVTGSAYRDNMYNQYNIDTGTSGRVVLTSGNIDIEGYGCDYIEIYETNDDFSELTFAAYFEDGTINYPHIVQMVS